MSEVDWAKGTLMGMAVGDAIGLPREMLSKSRAQALFGVPPMEHALLFGKGMISDDTEHACMVAQALIATENVDGFASSLAWKLRFWLLGLPGGVGLATLRSIMKLWLGFSPSKSGVYSAGNGPAMRAPVLGAYFAFDEGRMFSYVRASTRLTHTDEKAYEGALSIAHLAALARREGELDLDTYFQDLQEIVKDADLAKAFQLVETALREEWTLEKLTELQGWQKGVSGYIVHTVPACVYVCLRWGDDFREAIEQTVMLGGDTDTTAAIVGGVLGVLRGGADIPTSWTEGLMEFPRNTSWIERLAARLTDRWDTQKKGDAIGLFWPMLPLRNLFFLMIVLSHGVRRLFPPYS